MNFGFTEVLCCFVRVTDYMHISSLMKSIPALNLYTGVWGKGIIRRERKRCLCLMSFSSCCCLW